MTSEETVIKNDQNLRAKIPTIDMVVKEIKYHNCCRLKYNKKAKALSPKEISNNCYQNIWQKEREVYKKAFHSLKYYLEETIVYKQQVLFLTEVTSHYEALIHNIGGANFKESSPASQKLLEKIRKEMDKSITIFKTNKGKHVI